MPEWYRHGTIKTTTAQRSMKPKEAYERKLKAKEATENPAKHNWIEKIYLRNANRGMNNPPSPTAAENKNPEEPKRKRHA